MVFGDGWVVEVVWVLGKWVVVSRRFGVICGLKIGGISSKVTKLKAEDLWQNPKEVMSLIEN